MPKRSKPAVSLRQSRTPTDRRACFEQLETRRLAAANHDVGINVNANDDASVAKALPVLKSLGVTSVRLWYTLANPADRSITGGMARAIDYANAGYDVTLTVHPKNGQMFAAGDVKGWFDWAAGNSKIAKAVDRWEVGNEVDADYYWKGNLKQYVNNLLKPASEGLRAHGEKVVSAGVSWNPADVKEMIGYGMLNLVDAVGFHPYANGVQLQQQRIDEINAVVAGRKPIIATEWNVRGYESNKTKWAQSVAPAYENVHAGFDLDYYYCLFTTNTPAGPAGLIDKQGVQNTSFYKAFLAGTRGVASGPVDETPAPSTPTPTPTPSPSGGSNSGGSTSGGGSSSGGQAVVALYDADTNRVLSGYADIKDDQVIDLADLPSGHRIGIVVTPAKGATSVKMTLDGLTKVESTAPYSYFGDDGWTNIKGGLLTPGTHAFKATPYAQDDATGAAFASRSLTLTVKAATAGGDTSGGGNVPASTGDADKTPEFRGLSLVNAATGTVISGYKNLTAGATVKLASLTTRSLALVANVDEDAKSVKLTTEDGTRTENTPPYAFFGDEDGRYTAWTPVAGTYDFTAVAYGAKNATGTKGQTLSLSLRFV